MSGEGLTRQLGRRKTTKFLNNETRKETKGRTLIIETEETGESRINIETGERVKRTLLGIETGGN